MNLNDAINKLNNEFPFKGYILPEFSRIYTDIAATCQKFLQPGSKILDFGSGPCDKTAVLQSLGYDCHACDDLGDDWHKQDGNDRKIIAFAEKCGIKFTRTGSGPLPYEKNYFDMVMLHHVIEHLHDSPRGLLNDLLELVKPGGLLMITVPNATNIRKRIDVAIGKTNYPDFSGYYSYPGQWRGHIREYARGDLKLLAGFLGLEQLELRGCDNMLQQVPLSLRICYLTVTKLFDGWKDSWLLLARKEASTNSTHNSLFIEANTRS
jgi:SAM-dependent methyltransferase